jgi:F0F1-type ATP synthase membrane subunit b/b'
MSQAIPPMIVEIELETARIKSQLDDLTRQFQNMGDNIGKQTSKVDGVTGAFKKLGGALIAVAAGAQVVQFFKEAVAGASAFEAEFEGVNQTFGTSAKIVQDYAKTAAYSAGLSEVAALRAAKGFGAFAGAAGLAGDDAAKFATTMVQAAGDLGSFYDLPTGDAMAAIQSGLRGQFEPLRRFNILIDDATLRQRALQMGMIETTKQALTPQQKALAAQVEIMDQMGPAMGDFIKYQDTYGNAVKTVGALFEDMKTRLGQQLLPVLADLAMALMPLIEEIGPLAEKVFAALSPAIEALVPAIDSVIPILNPLFSILESIAEILAPLIEQLLPPFVKIFEAILPVIDKVAGIFVKLALKALPPFVKILDLVVLPLLDMFVGMLDTYMLPLLDRLATAFGDTLPIAADLFIGIFKTMKTVLEPIWTYVIKPLLEGVLKLAGVDFNTFTVSNKAAAQDRGEAARYGAMADFYGTGAGTGGSGTGTFTTPGSAKGGKTDAAGSAKKVSNQFTKIRSELNKDLLSLQKKFDDSSAEAQAKYANRIADITKSRNDDLAKALKDHNQKVIDINKDFSNRLTNIVKQSMDRLRNAFKGSAALDIGSVFGALVKGSDFSNVVSDEMKNGMRVAVSWWGQVANESGVGGVVLALKKQLEGSKKLAENAASLAGAGFSQTFIEQVVGQGTDIGNQMAEELLNSNPETIKELQSLYSEMEKVSETGLDALAKQIYEKNGLATTELKNMYADTQAQLVEALAAEQEAYAQAVADIQKTFTEAFAKAQVDLNNALADAYQSLADSLVATKAKFIEEMAALNLTAAQKSANTKTITALNKKIVDTKGKTAANTSQTINSNVYVAGKAPSAAEIAAANVQAIKFGVPITSIIPASRLLA